MSTNKPGRTFEDRGFRDLDTPRFPEWSRSDARIATGAASPRDHRWNDVIRAATLFANDGRPYSERVMAPPEGDEAGTGDARPVQSQRVVLLVDDEPFVLRAVARSLRQCNYRVLTAESAAAGLKLLSEHEVHLVISDQRMPVMSGTEFLTQVTERYPDTMRIMLSGYSDVQSVTQAMRVGSIYRFLPKPWEEHDLLQAIDAALRFGEVDRESRRGRSQ